MFFRLKWLQPAMKGTLLVCVRRSCVKVAWFRGCMRNTVVFWSWALQIVVEWLHQGCDSDLSADFLHFGAGDFPLKIPFQKCFNFFFSFGAESRFWSCNSISRCCIVTAASRLLGAAAACVILHIYIYCLLQLDIVNRIGVAASRLR